MIKLICPRCMKPVPVPDDFVGKEVTCPNCMKPFDAPARYTPAVLPEAPPPQSAAPAAPPPVPPRPPEPTMSPEVPSRPPESAPPAAPPPGLVIPPPVPAPGALAVPEPRGYAHAVGVTISPRVVAWLPAVFLTAAFVATFFRWIGSYWGGYPVYSQSPWRALFGRVNRNFDLEKYMPGGGAWIDRVSADWGLMLPFLLFLLAATLLAWADRLLSGRDPGRLPPPLVKVWPWRRTVILGLAGLALLLVVVQVSRGFGMERAIRSQVRESPELVKAREAAAGSPALLAKVENDEVAALDQFRLERTWAQDGGLACIVLAVLAVCASILLEKRGNKPPPRIVLHY